MNRRRVLATLGSALPLAGCLTGRSDQSNATATPTATVTDAAGNTPTATPTPTLDVGDTYETADGRTLAVADVHLRRSVFDLFVPDAVYPLVEPDSQFVFLTLPLDDPNAAVPAPRSFSLALDDAIHVGAERIGGAPIDDRLSIPNDDVHPTPERAVEVEYDRATVGFEVPLRLETDRAVVEWSDGEETARWVWDDDLVEALCHPPEFEVAEIDLDGPFTCGEPFDASVTVENRGGREGVFDAVFPAVTPRLEEHPQSLSLHVTTDEEATWEGTLQYPPWLQAQECDEDTEMATFELDWGLGLRTVTVERDG